MTELTPQSGLQQTGSESTPGSETEPTTATEADLNLSRVPVETPQSPPAQDSDPLAPPLTISSTEGVLTNAADEASPPSPTNPQPENTGATGFTPEGAIDAMTQGAVENTLQTDAPVPPAETGGARFTPEGAISAMTQGAVENTLQPDPVEKPQEPVAKISDTAAALEASKRVAESVIEARETVEGGATTPADEGETTFGNQTGEDVMEGIVQSWVRAMFESPGFQRPGNETQQYFEEIKETMRAHLEEARRQQREKIQARIGEYKSLDDEALRLELKAGQATLMELLHPEMPTITLDEIQSVPTQPTEARPLSPDEKRELAISAYITEKTLLTLMNDGDPSNVLLKMLSQKPKSKLMMRQTMLKAFFQQTLQSKYNWKSLGPETRRALKYAAGKPETTPQPAETPPFIDDSIESDPTT